MLSRTFTCLALLLLAFSGLSAQTEVTITDGDLNANTTHDWTNDNIYILDGLVYLEEGGILNIEEGTVIKGLTAPTTGDNTSALIITRDAEIYAEGTADAPIIFTASGDDTTDPDDLTTDDRGLWGGLIMLGDATVARPGGETGIEGIDAAETRARYGGTEDGDNSGVLRYVSIRHGGTALTSNNEINGLTLGGVGSATIIENIEVFANFDDGIEFFGGTVNVKNAVVAFCGDDGIDYDFGYRGKGQFWMVIQEPDNPAGTGRCGEHDGANPDNQAPFAQPTIYNATYIGVGTNATVSGGDAADANRFLVLMRDNAGGFYNNSLFLEGNGSAIAFEDRDDTADGDAFARLEAGDIAFNDNYFFGFNAGMNASDIFIAVDSDEETVPASSATVAANLGASNTIADPDLAGISRTPNGGLDPRINAGSSALGGATPSDDGFFTPVTFRGAFGNANLWIDSWTALDEYGYLGDLVTPTSTTSNNCITITDADLVGGETYNWGNGNCYLLDGLVYLEEDGVLNIEAGTPVFFKGANNVTTGDNTSALIITRDAQIFAEGTAEAPIIFTAEDDDLADPDDFTIDDRGLWGGLIMLGDATVARPGGETGIEGIDAAETRARYGGTEDGDNSGVLKYVSIRHGGTALTSNNEINGLTLGGVGSGTEIDFVEVIANFDDGIEFFGGTVDVKHATVAFCGDDGIDYDFGYRGRGQFWFVIQEPDNPDGTGRAGEHDGASPDNQAPFAQPNVYNATYVGVGTNAVVGGGDAADANRFLVLMRDNAGGFYNNSLFLEGNGFAIALEDRDDTADGDAFARFEAGDLAYNDNFFFGFGAGNTAADLFVAVNPDEDVVAGSSATVAAGFDAANSITDPDLGGISRMPNNMLDPRINAGSPALGGASPSDDGYFNPVTYRGAFGNSNLWVESWTALDEYGYLGDLVTPTSTTSDDCITITDADLVGGTTYTWGNGNCYLLDGLVYLEEDGVLNIEAGTPVFFKGANNVTTGDNTSALIITRDAQIFAEGTADAPIIFTAEDDDLADPMDFTIDDRGLWGGLIMLGDATVARPGGETGIEGIDAAETRARYGGTEDDDNSGVLRYVSIRHGGTALTSNNEINGLTLGGVGSGTEIEYVEVIANFDDGIEFFGGTVDVKHATVAFCGDDGIDYDFGYRGNGQFWFVIQEPDNPDGTGRAGEHDGASPDGQAPFAQPNVYNATYIGVGTNATVSGGDAADGNRFLVLMRDNAGGFYNNSLFLEGNGFAIALEDRDDTADGDAFARFEAGDLVYNDNFFFGFGAGNTAADLFVAVNPDEDVVAGSSATVAAGFDAANSITDPDLGGISRMPNNMLDPRINAGSSALGGATPSDNAFFNPVTYRGAFGNSNLWVESWTALDEYGYLGDLVTPTSTTSDDCITITDADLVGGQTYTWGSGNCYLLDGLVYLEEDGELNIEAGTPVFFKGPNNVTTGDNTSALIITRGAQIFAEGTSTDPIIFTAEDDDLSMADDLTIDDAGLWGGLIVLGDATIARPGGETGIEGIDAAETRARFGGTDDMDDSGVLRYISIRHGGTSLTANNEINGLTLGGVGAGTEIDYVEVFANFDDGIEFFGGTVDVKHAAVAFCGDDGIDYDFGYRGRGQYWFTLQDGSTIQGTGRAGEHDGASPDNQAPFAQPTVFNATYIGIGENATATGGDAADVLPFAILLRDNAGGFYNNSIFTDFNGVAIGIEDRDDTADGDAFARLEAGDLAFNNNFFFGFGGGTTAADLFVAVNPDEEIVMSSSATVAANFTGNNNMIADPVLQELTDRNMLDPRPTPISPAATGAPAPTDDFFDTVPYYGAFAPGNGMDNPSWLEGWTAIDEYGEVFLTVGVGTVESAGFLLDAPAPNPAANQTTVMLELPRSARVDMTIVDLMGRQVQQVLKNELMFGGEQQVNINTANLPNGSYFILMEAEGARLIQKLVINQ